MKLGKILTKIATYEEVLGSHNYWTPRLSKDLSFRERFVLERVIKGNNAAQIKIGELQNYGLFDNIIDLLF